MRGVSKPRKFEQAVELQIGLRNYNAKKEKKLTADIDLPNLVKKKLKVISIVDTIGRDECLKHNLEHIDLDFFKKYNGDVKAIKKWARAYDVLLVSASLNR